MCQSLFKPCAHCPNTVQNINYQRNNTVAGAQESVRKCTKTDNELTGYEQFFHPGSCVKVLNDNHIPFMAWGWLYMMAMDKVIVHKRFGKRWWIRTGGAALVVIALVVLYMGAIGSTRASVEASRLTIDEVKQASFEEFIPVTATVMPIKTVFLNALEGGTVEEIFAEDGKNIQKGEPILRLNNPQLQMDAINREAQLLDQQNNLRNTRLAMDKQTTALKESLLQLNFELKQLKKTHELNKKLLTENLIAKNDYEKTEDEYNLKISKRKLLLQDIKNDSVFRMTQTGQIDASLELIQKNLLYLQNSLQNLVIKAPIDGQLSALRAELGESKNKGENICQIDIMTDFKIRARVSEHYVSRIHNDITGHFTFNDSVFKVKVGKIFPEVTNGEFEVDLFFVDKRPAGIKRGQTLQVKLELSAQTRAVLVPRGAFYQNTGGNWIYVLTSEDKAVKREIKLGRQNPDYYEVLDGLSPGEKVITSSYGMFNNADEIIIKR